MASLVPCAVLAQFPSIPIQQSCSNSNNAASITCVFDRNVTTGNAVIIGVSYFGTSNTATATDTLGTTYTRVVSDVSHTEKIAVLTGIPASSGTNTITVAATGGSFMNVNGVELIGQPCDVTTVDVSAVSTFSGTPATVTLPSITTTLNGDCIYAGTGNDNSVGWQGLQDADLGTWWQTGSTGGADSGAGFFRIGGLAGAGNNLTVDNGGTSGTTFNVAFKSNALAINSPATAPDGGTTSTYSYTELATGGVGAYTWSVISGALPTGLSINSSTGAITGTPSVSNNYTATIQVADAGSAHTATKSTTFKITTGLSAISFVQGTSVAGGQQGANTLAYGSNVTAGNMLIVNMGFPASRARIGYCTDTVGTSYKLLTAVTNSIKATNDPTNITGLMTMAGIAPSSGANTVTCGASNQFVVAVTEFSNINFASSDNNGFTRGTTPTPATLTSGSLTTLVPNELIFGVCLGYTATSLMTVNASFTQVGNLVPSGTGYRIVTTATGYTMSCNEATNTSGIWVFGLTAFRPGNGTVTAGTQRHKGQIL